jgi:AraC-like DNA-binding protein
MLEDSSPANCIQRIIPDGRPELILNFGNPFESLTKGVWNSQPGCFFVGQITGPLLLRPSGPAGMLGIDFRPHGAASLLGLPICELTDSAIALEDLSRRLFRELERVRDLSSLTQALTALDPALCAFAEQSRIDDDPVSWAVREIERSSGMMSVRDVADRIGWSTRQLQRRFKDSVGISPKLFERMQRFQRVFRVMEDATSNWVDVSIDCGHYDQAHLIRDFREFSGKTPTALLDKEIDLVKHFVKGRSMSHFSKTAGSRPRWSRCANVSLFRRKLDEDKLSPVRSRGDHYVWLCFVGTAEELCCRGSIGRIP